MSFLALIVFLVSCDCWCSVAIPHGAVDWSAVCECGISSSYSLTFWKGFPNNLRMEASYSQFQSGMACVPSVLCLALFCFFCICVGALNLLCCFTFVFKNPLSHPFCTLLP